VRGSIVAMVKREAFELGDEELLPLPPPASAAGESSGILCVAIGTNGDAMVVSRKIDDLRLVESRKSARLIDQDTDYIRLSDPPFPDNKKRMVSTVIDVPTPQVKHR